MARKRTHDLGAGSPRLGAGDSGLLRPLERAARPLVLGRLDGGRAACVSRAHGGLAGGRLRGPARGGCMSTTDTRRPLADAAALATELADLLRASCERIE